MAKKKKAMPKRGHQGAGGVKQRASPPPKDTLDEREPDVPASEPPPPADSERDPAASITPSVPPVSSPYSGAHREPPREKAAWGKPLVRLERVWTRFEARLLFVVLIFLLASLVFWIALSGMASPIATGNSAGTVFRGIVGVTVLGLAARLLTRNRGLSEQKRSLITLGAAVVGGLLAPSWRSVGVEYSGQLLNWLQEGSSLTLFGGLRGVATRLTILLALVGASLAAASGKHINIDVVLRFIPAKLRIPVHFIGALATSAVCLAASWGFFDYISIEGFGVDRDAKAGEKVSHVAEDLGDDFFIWRKQVGLDLSTLPDVAGGMAWDDPSRMNGREWNEFIRDGGFYERFEKEEVDMILAPDFALEESRVPMVQMPGKTVRGLLIHAMNLMFPIGLVFIGLRVMLRALLVIAGYSTVEPDPDEIEVPQDGIPAPTAAALRSIGEPERPAESPDDGPAEGPGEGEVVAEDEVASPKSSEEVAAATDDTEGDDDDSDDSDDSDSGDSDSGDSDSKKGRG